MSPDLGSIEQLVTWLFEEASFAPTAKLTAHGNYGVVCDHLGTPLELYDQRGTKTWQAQLDSYGAVRQGLGRPQDCPFRYQGQYEDTETGLYYNRFRYYDPEAGQYISQDPIRLNGGRVLYGYVSNPTRLIDPLGLSLKCGLTGVEVANASDLPIIKPGTKQWRQAVEDMRRPGKSKNYRVENQEQAEQLLNEARPMSKYDTYTKTEEYKKGYEIHPNEQYSERAPHNNLEHVKWKDWESGKASGGNGHIFW